MLGNITLNISSTIYIIWLIPQIILNFRRKNTAGLSILMHGILCIGCLADLIYGFGTAMQWQYKMVTIIGLCTLAIQHYQFGQYGLQRSIERFIYIAFSILCLILFAFAIDAIAFHPKIRNFYDIVGMIANTCWLSYTLPQIIKNYFNQSAIGLSIYFLFLSIFLNACDFTSAWMLNWDYPSKIGPLFTLSGNLILLLQVCYYEKCFTRLAIDR